MVNHLNNTKLYENTVNCTKAALSHERISPSYSLEAQYAGYRDLEVSSSNKGFWTWIIKYLPKGDIAQQWDVCGLTMMTKGPYLNLGCTASVSDLAPPLGSRGGLLDKKDCCCWFFSSTLLYEESRTMYELSRTSRLLVSCYADKRKNKLSKNVNYKSA